MTLEERIESARALRAQGYNCAQCVMAVFPEVHGLPQDVALRLSTGLGGGVGGSQNICGVLSSVALLDGSRTQGAPADKRAVYGNVSGVVRDFEQRYGTCICRELKAPGQTVGCNELIEAGIRMYDDFLKK